MEARRFFSTRLRGLRLDAAVNGVRMGGTVGHRSGPLVVQLLQTGRRVSYSKAVSSATSSTRSAAVRTRYGTAAAAQVRSSAASHSAR